MSDEHSSDPSGVDPPTETVGPLAENTNGAEAAGPSTLAAGEVLGNRFRIESRLGSGSFGIVYRARDLRLDQDVAIKVLRTDRLDARGFERVRQEARLARQARGDRLVRIFDLEEVDAHLFLVMELVEGGTLRDLMQREAPLGFERARELAREILECLAQLHGQNVLHRDIKPANILVDSRGRLRLGDFGLARSLAGDTRLTATGRTLGSAAYLYPESGDAVDARSDLYSFGVVLFEMLAGRLPFEATDPLELIKAHLSDPAPDLRELKPDIPPELADLVRRLMVKSPEDRPASAEKALALLDSSGPKTLPRPQSQRRWSLRIGGSESSGRQAVLVAMLVLGIFFAASRLLPVLGGNEGSGRIDSPPALEEPAACQLAFPVVGGSKIEIHSRGRVLRSVEGTIGARKVMLESGREAVLAVFDHDRSDIRRRWRIELRDCLSDDLLAQRYYSKFHHHFEPTGFSDHYQATISTQDHDEHLPAWISFDHRPYWPSHVVIFDLEEDEVQGVFYNSGHTRFLGLVDVDGDGRDEALFSGTNNRLGFQPFIAAVDLNAVGVSSRAVNSGHSPDANYDEYGNSLIWYTLLPKSIRSVDPTNEIVTDGHLSFREEGSGRERVYRLDGTDAAEALTRARVMERRRAQNEAYASYRNAETHLRRSRAEKALASFRKGREAAHRARDAPLAWWIDIRIGQLLIELGKQTEADSHFDRILKTLGEDRPERVETLFQQAVARHLAGRPSESSELYERALEESGLRTGFSRFPWEIMENWVLALIELGRPGEARAVTEAYRELHPQRRRIADPYRAYVEWQSGEPIVPITLDYHSTDLPLYWHHEFRWLKEGASKALLDDVREATHRSSESKGMLQALEAVLLREQGQAEEAEVVCAEARAWLERWRREVVAARGHSDIISERCGGPESAKIEPRESRDRSARTPNEP